MKTSKLGIIGAGPVGSILAVYLRRAGHDVHLVEIDPALVTAMTKDGLTLQGPETLHADMPNVTTSISALQDKNLDYVFISIKTIDLGKITTQLKGFDPKVTCLINLQNGIDPEEVVAEIYPRDRVFRSVCHYAGMIPAPGKVKLTFFHPPNYVGEISPEGLKTAQDIAALMTNAGLTTNHTSEIKKKAWHKSILNSMIMPVSVVTRLTMGKIMSCPETRRTVSLAGKEAIDVAAAEGHVYELDFHEKCLQYLSSAGEHKTSMLMDFLAGKPLEIDFLNQKIQEYAEKHGIPCPYNEVLVALVKGAVLHRT